MSLDPADRAGIESLLAEAERSYQLCLKAVARDDLSHAILELNEGMKASVDAMQKMLEAVL